MSLGGHLEELRSRVIRSVFVLAAAFILCLFFRNWLWAVLSRPHVMTMRALGLSTQLKYSGYFEVAFVQLKACAVAGAVLASPYLIYQIWAFIAPGLYIHERRKVIKIGAACLFCLLAGVALGYFFFVPLVLRGLVALSGPWAEPVLMIGNYFSALVLLTFVLGVSFQTPVVVYFLVRWGILDPRTMQKHRRLVVLCAFIVAAVITPTVDPITQTLVAVTLIVLYDVGGLLAAPSVATAKGFFTFTGLIVLAGGAMFGWYRYWPIGEATALKGGVVVGKAQLADGATQRLTRGSVCRTDAGGEARLALGRAGRQVVYMAPGSRLQVNDPDALSLYAGDVLVSDAAGSGLTVRSGVATVAVAGGRTELNAPDEDTLTATVFEGEARVTADGRTTRLAAGRTATFRAGGEPTDLSAAEARWRQLTEHGR